MQSILKNEILRNLLVYFFIVFIATFGYSQHDHHQPEEHQQEYAEHVDESPADSHNNHADHSEERYNPTPTIMHHIADANEWRLFGNVAIPLPVMIYNQDHGNWFTGSSRQFHPDSHGNGTVDVNDYHMVHSRVVPMDGSKYIDFSITKNVATLLLTSVIMLLVFIGVAKGYKKRPNAAPKGIQSFFEPIIQFVRDDIAKPNLGKKTDKFLPYLLTVFFFIWIANMLGQIAPIGSPNLTGNIAVTAALAMFTMLLTNINGTSYYWQHIFDPMGHDMPWYGKIFLYPVLVPIEVAGIFLKPIALMIRLFANITAGHIIVLSLVSLIFVFGNAGQSLGGSLGGVAISVPFTLFISVIELLVAFLQAFIFTILSAVFIGMAIEEGH